MVHGPSFAFGRPSGFLNDSGLCRFSSVHTLRCLPVSPFPLGPPGSSKDSGFCRLASRCRQPFTLKLCGCLGPSGFCKLLCSRVFPCPPGFHEAPFTLGVCRPWLSSFCRDGRLRGSPLVAEPLFAVGWFRCPGPSGSSGLCTTTLQVTPRSWASCVLRGQNSFKVLRVSTLLDSLGSEMHVCLVGPLLWPGVVKTRNYINNNSSICIYIGYVSNLLFSLLQYYQTASYLWPNDADPRFVSTASVWRWKLDFRTMTPLQRTWT